MTVWLPVPVLPMPRQIAEELDRQRELDHWFGPVTAYWLTRDGHLLPLPFPPAP